MPAVIKLLALLTLDLLVCLMMVSGQFSPPFRFDGFAPPEPTTASLESANADENNPGSTSGANSNNSSRPLVWQPLRATFRPLNRPASPAPPSAPVSPTPPAPPVPLALSLGTEPVLSSSGEPATASDANIDRLGSSASSGDGLSTTGLASDLTAGNGNIFSAADNFNGNNNPTPTPAPASSRDSLDNEDLPTRVPLSRFRPTKAPSSDPQTQPTPSPVGSAAPTIALAATSRSHNLTSTLATGRRTSYITSDCLECICEASTNCNPNSRCQTSDVRHTRCGMFLISYDQWLETGLSKELVSAEALSQDAAADERAFYDCVTNRDCAERLLTIYAHKSAKDCDRDGRIDCYDMAAVHQGGLDGCQSEPLLESQYWSDFNACFGFGR